MKLLTKAIREKLLKNGRITADCLDAEEADGSTPDFKPVVKFFTPFSNCTWLLTELDSCGDRAFGLCDLGMQSPELGYVLISELESIKGPFGLGVERDLYWTPRHTLSEYATEARNLGAIRS